MGQPCWMTWHMTELGIKDSGICYLRGFCGDVTSHENQEYLYQLQTLKSSV